jgi:hypothetical protein
VFSLTSRKLLFSSLISSMTHWSLSNVLFSFQLFACFLQLFLLLSPSFSDCDKIECMELFLLSYFCWGLLCASSGEGSMGYWEECIFCRSWMKYSVDIS